MVRGYHVLFGMYSLLCKLFYIILCKKAKLLLNYYSRDVGKGYFSQVTAYYYPSSLNQLFCYSVQLIRCPPVSVEA